MALHSAHFSIEDDKYNSYPQGGFILHEKATDARWFLLHSQCFELALLLLDHARLTHVEPS